MLEVSPSKRRRKEEKRVGLQKGPFGVRARGEPGIEGILLRCRVHFFMPACLPDLEVVSSSHPASL